MISLKGRKGDGASKFRSSDLMPEDDFKAVGLLFLETVILSLTKSKDPTTQSFIERLAFEIFKYDFAGLKYAPTPSSFPSNPCREYCLNEPNWSHAVLFLNEREEAGWKLLQKLLEGDISSISPLEHRFLE